LDALPLLVGVRRLVALPGAASRGLLLVSGGVNIADGGVKIASGGVKIASGGVKIAVSLDTPTFSSASSPIKQ